MWALSWVFSLEFPQKFQNSFVQEQSYEVSTLKEMDELLKDLIRSALRAFKGICKFFQLLLKVQFGPLILKNILDCIIIIFHLCLTNPSFQPAGYNVGWCLLFHIWCKTIKWPFLFPVSKNAKMCVCVCLCVCVCVCVCERSCLCWKKLY